MRAGPAHASFSVYEGAKGHSGTEVVVLSQGLLCAMRQLRLLARRMKQGALSTAALYMSWGCRSRLNHVPAFGHNEEENAWWAKWEEEGNKVLNWGQGTTICQADEIRELLDLWLRTLDGTEVQDHRPMVVVSGDWQIMPMSRLAATGALTVDD